MANLEVSNLPLQLSRPQLGGLQLVLARAPVRLQRRPLELVLLRDRSSTVSTAFLCS